MKRIVRSIIAAVLTTSMLTLCSCAVNEPCMYCHHSPSKAYKKSDGDKVYVCKTCSSRCMLYCICLQRLLQVNKR